MKKLFFISLLLFLLTFSLNANGFDYYIITGPDQFQSAGSQSYPGHYKTYVDKAFGTTIRRFTDTGSSPTSGTRPMYPARAHYLENSDGSLVIIGFNIHTTSDGEYRCKISGSTYDSYCWSDTTPNVLYLFDGNTTGSGGKFYKVKINTDTWEPSYSLLAQWDPEDFPDSAAHKAYFGTADTFKKAFIHDEGPVSWDGRHWLIAVDYMDDEGENISSLLVWIDRDKNGFESPGIIGMGWVPCKIIYNAGISPGGNYMYWRPSYNTCPSMCNKGTCVRTIKRSNFTGTKTDLVNLAAASTKLSEAQGYHYCLAYDDLGNEIYVTTDEDKDLAYWRFNKPGNENRVKICSSNWLRSGSSEGFGDSHYGTVAGNSYTRSWIAWLPTDSGSGDECGYESTGQTTIIFIKCSASDQNVWAVAHSKNDAVSYKTQLFGGGSRDGLYYYYNNSWCQTQNMEVFRVELPSNWWSEIGETKPAAPKGLKIIQ